MLLPLVRVGSSNSIAVTRTRNCPIIGRPRPLVSRRGLVVWAVCGIIASFIVRRNKKHRERIDASLRWRRALAPPSLLITLREHVLHQMGFRLPFTAVGRRQLGWVGLAAGPGDHTTCLGLEPALPVATLFAYPTTNTNFDAH